MKFLAILLLAAGVTALAVDGSHDVEKTSRGVGGQSGPPHDSRRRSYSGAQSRGVAKETTRNLNIIIENTVKGGTVKGGTVKGGTVKGGTVKGGTVKNGTVKGGTVKGGSLTLDPATNSTVKGDTQTIDPSP